MTANLLSMPLSFCDKWFLHLVLGASNDGQLCMIKPPACNNLLERRMLKESTGEQQRAFRLTGEMLSDSDTFLFIPGCAGICCVHVMSR